MAGVSCFAALVFQSYHLYTLYLAIPHCLEEPYEKTLNPGWLLAIIDFTRNNPRSCVCDRSLFYQGLPCFDVKRQLPFIITAMAALNFMSFFISSWYFGLITFGTKSNRWKPQNTDDQSATQPMIQNKS